MPLIEINRAFLTPAPTEQAADNSSTNMVFDRFGIEFVEATSVKYVTPISFGRYAELTPEESASLKDKLPSPDEMGTHIQMDDGVRFFVREPCDNLIDRLGALGVKLGRLSASGTLKKKKPFGFEACL